MGIENVAGTLKYMINHTLNGDLNWIYHIGDISYADDRPEFQSTWNTFSQNVEPMSSRVPYMVIPL
jgi:hypothetical protein